MISEIGATVVHLYSPPLVYLFIHVFVFEQASYFMVHAGLKLVLLSTGPLSAGIMRL